MSSHGASNVEMVKYLLNTLTITELEELIREDTVTKMYQRLLEEQEEQDEMNCRWAEHLESLEEEMYFEEEYDGDFSLHRKPQRTKGYNFNWRAPPKRRPKRHIDDEAMKLHKHKVAISKARLRREDMPTKSASQFDTAGPTMEQDNPQLVEDECIICERLTHPVPLWSKGQHACLECREKWAERDLEGRLKETQKRLDLLWEEYECLEDIENAPTQEEKDEIQCEMMWIQYDINTLSRHKHIYMTLLNPHPVVFV